MLLFMTMGTMHHMTKRGAFLCNSDRSVHSQISPHYILLLIYTIDMEINTVAGAAGPNLEATLALLRTRGVVLRGTDN